MFDVDTNSKSEQRKFGLVMASVLSLLAFLRWLFHGFAMAAFPAYILGVGLLFLCLSIVAPFVLGPIFRLWLKFAEVMNWVMTRVLLGTTFFLLVTPIRGLMRMFSEDPLKRKWLPKTESYWEIPEEQPREFERYQDQF